MQNSLLFLLDLGGDGPVRAGHLAGVQTRPKGRAVHRAGRDLRGQTGAVVPRAGADHRHQDDKYF